jgi:hypothetical protein
MSDENPAGDNKNKKRSVIALVIIGCVGVLLIGGFCMAGKRTVSGVEGVNSTAEQKIQSQLAALSTARVSNLEADGKLATLFKIGSKDTNAQRDAEVEAIRGEVIEWQLPVEAITAEGDYYKIQTTSGPNVGTFLDVYPQDQAGRAKIEALKAGDLVQVRGYVNTVVLRKVVISPAILVD